MVRQGLQLPPLSHLSNSAYISLSRASPASFHHLAAVITTIVLIRAEPSSIPTTAQFLAEIEGVTEVYSVSGDWDLVAIVKVAEYDQIARVVTEFFPKVPGLQRTQTLTAFRAYSKKDLQQAWDMGIE